MPVRSRRGFIGRGRIRPRAKTQWQHNNSDVTGVAAGAQNLTVLVNDQPIFEEMQRCTHLLTLGWLRIAISNAPVAAQGLAVYAGLFITEVSAQGTQTPNTVTDGDQEWMWLGAFFLDVGGTGVSDENAGRFNGNAMLPVHTKSRRRGTEDCRLTLVLNTSGNANVTWEYSYFLRSLYRLH